MINDDIVNEGVENAYTVDQMPLKNHEELLAIRKELNLLKRLVYTAIKVCTTKEQMDEITRIFDEKAQ